MFKNVPFDTISVRDDGVFLVLKGQNMMWFPRRRLAPCGDQSVARQRDCGGVMSRSRSTPAFRWSGTSAFVADAVVVGHGRKPMLSLVIGGTGLSGPAYRSRSSALRAARTLALKLANHGYFITVRRVVGVDKYGWEVIA